MLNACVSSKSAIQEQLYLHPLDTYDVTVKSKIDIPEKRIKKLERKLQKELTKAKLYNAAANRQLEVTITDYHTRNRILGFYFGFFVGIEHMTSSINVIDPRNDASDGIYTIKTKNHSAISWSGLLIADHADQIVAQVKPSKKELRKRKKKQKKR